jgi:hypothetical protein
VIAVAMDHRLGARDLDLSVAVAEAADPPSQFRTGHLGAVMGKANAPLVLVVRVVEPCCIRSATDR